jgi:septum formation inhibitor-activating ATPase MinD
MVARGRQGTLLVVVGASGGVGASTLAAAIAVRAAAADASVALVDGCPWGGGLDVVLGADRRAGSAGTI